MTKWHSTSERQLQSEILGSRQYPRAVLAVSLLQPILLLSLLSDLLP